MPWRLRVFTTCVILGWAAAVSSGRAGAARVSTDRPEKLIERPFTNSPPPFPPGLPRYAGETDAGEAALTDGDLRRFGEVTLNDGWLWISSAGGQPWGRIHLADGRRESFGPLRNNGLPFMMIYLVPTADPQMLVVGDTYALWGLRMGDSQHE